MKKIKYIILIVVSFSICFITNTKALEIQTPSNLKVSSNYYNKINITFDQVECDGYEIYRYNSTTKKYSLIKTTTINNYTNTNLSFNKTYYYKVRAYKIEENKKIYSDFSTIKSTKTKLTIPNITLVKERTISSLAIYYTNIYNETGYEIYRSTSKTGKYYLITRTTKRYYYDKNTFNKTYYYKVRAYKTINNKRIYSNFSNIYTKRVILNTPNITVSKYNYNTIKISFNKVVGATRYQIYKYNDTKGLYEYIGYTTNSYYLSSNLTSGKEYKFKVRAYAVVNNIKRYSTYSDEKLITPIPTTPKITLDNNIGNESIKINISAVAGDTKYEIYKLNNEQNYDLLTTTSNSNYIDSNLILGNDYSYKVRAYTIENNEKVYSEYSNIENTRCIPKPTTISFVNNNSSYDTQIIKFNYVDNAAKYEIYRKVYGGTYQLIETVEGNEIDPLRTTHQHTISNLKFNTTYYYKIISYKNDVASNSSNVLIKTTRLNTITDNHTQYIKNNSINITWDIINGATGYEIYYSNKKSGTYKYLYRTTRSYYKHENLTTGKYYYYKVRPYKIVNSKRIYGYFSNISSKYIRSTTNYKIYTKSTLLNYLKKDGFKCTTSTCSITDTDDGVTTTMMWYQNSNKYVTKTVTVVDNLPMTIYTTYYYKSNYTYTTFKYDDIALTYKYNYDTNKETVNYDDYNNNIELFNAMITIEELNCTIFDGMLYKLGLSVSGL